MAIKLSRGIRLLLIIPFWATSLCVAAENEDNATVTTSAIAITIPTVEESGPIDALAEDRLAQLFRLYMEAQSTGMIDEAEVLAKQIIEMTIESFGFESKQTARALTDLGSLQTSNADYHAAVLNYASAIEIIENLDDRLSMDLIVPLKGIGAAHKGAGNTDLAAASWQRAVHISHVNFGPHNYEQVESLVSIGRLYVAAGMSKEVRRIQRRIAYLQARDRTVELPRLDVGSGSEEILVDDVTQTMDRDQVDLLNSRGAGRRYPNLDISGIQ